MAVIVREPDVDTFIELSWQLNAHDPYWIPPIRARLRQELTGADAFGRYGRLRLFGCESDSRLVGRVAAIVNPRLVDASGHPVGQVGYFESVNDESVSSALFAAAFEWLRAAGAQQVWGPMNGGPHRNHRFMTEGFDRAPFLFEVRNLPYYADLFASSGFVPIYTWYSTEASSDHLRHLLADRPMLKVREATRRQFDLVPCDPSDAETVLRRMYALLDAMWTGHPGYTSVDFAEFVELFAPALSLMTIGNIHVAVDRVSGRDVGCVFTIPDYAAEVRALNGDATGWGSWPSGGARPRRLVLHTFGMAPEVRRTGLASWLLRVALEHCVENYDEGVFAFTTQDIAAIGKLGSVRRRYALYARSID